MTCVTYSESVSNLFIYGIILRKPIIESSNAMKMKCEKMKMTEAKCSKKWEW
jgi:hypothetical protein